jgi:hypothetical protein
MEEGELMHLSCVVTRYLTDVFDVFSLSLFYLFLSALVKDYFAGSLEGKVRVSS